MLAALTGVAFVAYSDLPADVQLDLFSGLIKGALDSTASGRRGVEETAAAVTSVFLRGARTT